MPCWRTVADPPMLTYLDSSALVKLFLDEEGSDAVRSWVEQQAPSTCRISWVEARSALARRERDWPHAAQVCAEARQALVRRWPQLRIVELTPEIAEAAAGFAELYALRAYDAVQLAAAQDVALALEERVRFGCFDRRLNRAARSLGLELPQGVPT